MRRAPRRSGAAALAAWLASGCAYIENGALPQTISLESRPPGASATVLPDYVIVETPAQIQLSRRDAHTIRFELEGYCRETVYIDRVTTRSRDFNWLWLIFAPLAFWADSSSGAGYRLTPDEMNVFLWPADSPERECGPAGAVPRPERKPLPEPL